MNKYQKWSNYKIGQVTFIEKNRYHPSRKLFIDWVLKNNVSSVVEIGPGELIEGKSLLEENKNLSYTVCDVSSVFLEHCRSDIRFKCVETAMDQTPFNDKEFDLLYMNAVFEHSPDIKKSVKEWSRISKRFFITLFKWRMLGGDLESVYHTAPKKRYWSTEFNLQESINLINKYGVVNDMIISLKDENSFISYQDYIKNINKDIDEHRNGNYLSLIGNWH